MPVRSFCSSPSCSPPVPTLSSPVLVRVGKQCLRTPSGTTVEFWRSDKQMIRCVRESWVPVMVRLEGSSCPAQCLTAHHHANPALHPTPTPKPFYAPSSGTRCRENRSSKRSPGTPAHSQPSSPAPWEDAARCVALAGAWGGGNMEGKMEPHLESTGGTGIAGRR